MIDYGGPVLYALFIWWFSTGAILFLDGLPRRTHAWSMAGATVVLVLGLYGLLASRDSADTTGAFIAFTSALAIWGWHETSFLLGYVTGPRKDPCPSGCAGFQRFRLATETIIFHEIAILVTALLCIAMTQGAVNQAGTWTFLALWVLRLSAKLNIFLGMPRLHAELLPDHLRYLQTYFRQRPMNLLFPVSVSAGTALTVLIVQSAIAPSANGYDVAAGMLLATLIGLGVIEHWFLVLPLQDTALWKWALSQRGEHAPVLAVPAAVALQGDKFLPSARHRAPSVWKRSTAVRARRAPV